LYSEIRAARRESEESEVRRRRNGEEEGGASEVKVFELWQIGAVRVLLKTVTVAWMRRSERCGEKGSGHGFEVWILSIQTNALFVCDWREK